MAKTLVTGGAGFIGSHLVEALLAAGHEVVVVDNLSTGALDNLRSVRGAIRFVEGDVRDQAALRPLLAGVSWVFHLAALASVPRSVADPFSSHDHNATGTLAALLAARDAGVSRFVYSASSSAYGDTETLPKVETMPARPRSPYAIGKYVGELYAETFHRLYGLETVSLRYFNIFGPRQTPDSPYAAVIPKFVTALLRGESPVVHGDGRQTRDFTFVANAVAANLRAAEAPADRVAGRVFNVGCGERTSLLDLLDELASLTGSRVAPRHVEPRAGDVRDSQADIEAARRALGYEPSVGLRDGLARTVEWYRETGRAATR
ncbi:MAG TPA: SDR family oxidoreductase [Thermodesulfobacteriota bacterium]